ncbi:echinoderm microtubule-associated protein-like CG42247 isoform X3 [Dermacentor albipictus]|uniref:echinoderm microtubule-associated protein-like CG42247 isoform X3 n=1 Tax=Dermacentor albipictus TaxID=60249 RepID=UPI0031FC7157
MDAAGERVAKVPRIRKINSTHSRFLAEAAQRKALMVTFFANGDPFSSGVRVSINPGRDFKTMESLYDYISQRLDVSNGVRVIFTLDGKKVPSLDDLEDGASYVASGTRAFAPLAYGQARSRILQRSDEDPSRLIHPVGHKKPTAKGGSVSLPGSGGRDDGRVIDVVSSLDPKHRSRVLLNLKTTQTFEEVLRDLGGALNMNGVKKMTTKKGEVVRSFSQLKYDLRDVNTFVLEPDDDNPLVRRRTRSFDDVQSLEEQQPGAEEPASDAARSGAKVLSRSESAPSPEGSLGSGEENEQIEDESSTEGNLKSEDADGQEEDESKEKDNVPSEYTESGGNNGDISLPDGGKAVRDTPFPELDGHVEQSAGEEEVSGEEWEKAAAAEDSAMVADDTATAVNDTERAMGPRAGHSPNGQQGSPVHMEQAELGSQAASGSTATASTNWSSPMSTETSSTSSHKTPTRRLERRPEICWAHGYQGNGPFSNLHVVRSGEILYNVAALAVLFNRSKHQQRFYMGHSMDIDCIAYNYNEDVAATGQSAGFNHAPPAHIRVWKTDTLETLAVLGAGIINAGLSCLGFSYQGVLLVAVDSSHDHELSLWDWQKNEILGRAVANPAPVLGCHFPPSENELLLTFGVQHLCFWRKGKENYLDRLDAITAEHAPKTITAVDFMGTAGFVTGDDAGYITVWSASKEGSYFFISKEFRAHENDVNVLLFLPHNLLISASAVDREDQIKAWDADKKFQKLGVTSLPKGTGGVHAMCQHLPNAADENVFVGTTHNLIMEGSFKRKFRPVIQSHCRETVSVVVSPTENIFFTVGRDRAVCRWNVSSLVWMTPVESECLSASMHPRGSALAVGCANGRVSVLAADTGAVLATFSVANSALNALAYSPGIPGQGSPAAPCVCLTALRTDTAFVTAVGKADANKKNV